MPAQKHRGEPLPAAAAHLNDLLDEALEETFPASDPVAIDVELQPPEEIAPRTRKKQNPVDAEEACADGPALKPARRVSGNLSSGDE